MIRDLPQKKITKYMPIKYVHIKPKNFRITAPIYYIGKILAKLLIIIHIVKILARKIY